MAKTSVKRRRKAATVCRLLPTGTSHWLHSADEYVRQKVPGLARADVVTRMWRKSALFDLMNDILWDTDKAMHAALKRLRDAKGEMEHARAVQLFVRAWDKFHAQQLAALTNSAHVIEFAAARARLIASGWTRPAPASDLVAVASRRARLAGCGRIEGRAR